MSGTPECHISWCREEGTLRMTAACRGGHVLDAAFCILHGDAKYAELRKGELHCGQCWSDFQGEIRMTEVACWDAL